MRGRWKAGRGIEECPSRTRAGARASGPIVGLPLAWKGFPRAARVVYDLEEDNKFLTRQIVHLQHKIIALQQGATPAAASATGTNWRCQGQQTDPGTPEGPGGCFSEGPGEQQTQPEPQRSSNPSPPTSTLSLGMEIALMQEMLSETPEMEAVA